MGFGDVFKSSFLENITSVSILDMVIALVLAFGIGMFIFFVYKKTYSGVMYAPGFGVTLVALTMITTVVILAVTSNVVLSLGMVAAGMLPLALIGSIFIGVMLLVFVNRKSHVHPYILIVQCDGHDSEVKVRGFMEKQVKKCVVKSKVAQPGHVELNLEVRMKDDNADFVNILSEMDGVNSASLVSFNGEYL